MAGWAAVAAAADGIIGIGGQAMTNHANRQNSEAQRNWNRQMWDLNNEYNNPKNQMQRLKDANLNPNLIYGSGASGATGQSSSPAKPYQKPEHKMSLGTPFQDFVQIRNSQAQTDNLQAATKTKEQETLLKIAQTSKTIADRDKTAYKFKELGDMSLAALQARVDNMEKDTFGKDIANTTAQGTQKYEIQQARQGVIKLRAEVRNINSQKQATDVLRKLRQYEANLNKMGIQKTDELYWRVIGQASKEIQDILKDLNFKL